MIRIIFLLTFALLISCTPQIFPEKEVKLRALSVETSLKGSVIPIKLEGIELSDYLTTQKILYKKDISWGYFAKNLWICTPDCMIKNLILKNINYLGETGKGKLKLEILDMYIDFSKEKPEVVLTINAKLEVKGKLKRKIFYIRKKSQPNEDAVFKTFNEVAKEFLVNLHNWIVGSTSDL